MNFQLSGKPVHFPAEVEEDGQPWRREIHQRPSVCIFLGL